MKEDLQKLWEERIQRAKKVREDWAKEFRVDEGWSYFEGQNNPGYPPDQWINVNKIYSHLQAQLPMLYSIDPYFYIKLKKSFQPDPKTIQKYELKGKGRLAMVNYLKGELDLKSKARMGILDAHFEYGVIKVRRAADWKNHPKAGESILDDDGNEMIDETTGGPLVYPDQLPVNERYEICWVNACDFLFDEDAGPLEDSWSWVAHHIQMKKKDALEDPRFKKKAVKAVQPKSKDDEEKPKSGFINWLTKSKQERDENEVIDIWEVYDLKQREWLFMAEDAEELLMVPRGTPKGIDGHPFEILRFSNRKKSPYPIPPVFNALDPQKEYSLSRSMLLTHRKRFNRKYEVNPNLLVDETELSKLENGEDGTYIRVNALGAVGPIQDAPLNQQNLQELMLLNNDLVEVFGTPSAARGVADADSATEASILDKRLEVREGDRISMVKDWVIGIAKKLDQLVQ